MLHVVKRALSDEHSARKVQIMAARILAQQQKTIDAHFSPPYIVAIKKGGDCLHG
jgi:hypothetical protein